MRRGQPLCSLHTVRSVLRFALFARANRPAGGDLKLAARFGLAANQLAARPEACLRTCVRAQPFARVSAGGWIDGRFLAAMLASF